MQYFINNDDWLKIWREEWKKIIDQVPNFEQSIGEHSEDLSPEACKVNKSRFLNPKKIWHINYFLKDSGKEAFFKTMGFSENDVKHILEKIENKFCLQHYIEQEDLESRFKHIQKEWIEPKFTRLVNKEQQEHVDFYKVLGFSSDLKIKFIKADIGKTFLLDYLFLKNNQPSKYDFSSSSKVVLHWRDDISLEKLHQTQKCIFLVDGDNHNRKRAFNMCKSKPNYQILMTIKQTESVDDVLKDLGIKKREQTSTFNFPRSQRNSDEFEYQVLEMKIDLTIRDMQKLVKFEKENDFGNKALNEFYNFLEKTSLIEPWSLRKDPPSWFQELRFFRDFLNTVTQISENIQLTPNNWSSLLIEIFCQQMTQLLSSNINYKKKKIELLLARFFCLWVVESFHCQNYKRYDNFILIFPSENALNYLWPKMLELPCNQIDERFLYEGISQNEFVQLFLDFPLWKQDIATPTFLSSRLEEDALVDVFRGFLRKGKCEGLDKIASHLPLHLNDSVLDCVFIVNNIIDDHNVLQEAEGQLQFLDDNSKNLLQIIIANKHDQQIETITQTWQSIFKWISLLVEKLESMCTSDFAYRSKKLRKIENSIAQNLFLLSTRYKHVFQSVSKKYGLQLNHYKLYDLKDESNRFRHYTELINQVQTLCSFQLANFVISNDKKGYRYYLLNNFDEWIEPLEWLAFEKGNKNAIEVFQLHIKKWWGTRYCSSAFYDIDQYEWFPAICVCNWEKKQFEKWYKKMSHYDRKSFFKDFIYESIVLGQNEKSAHVWNTIKKIQGRNSCMDKHLENILFETEQLNSFLADCVFECESSKLPREVLQEKQPYRNLTSFLDLLYKNSRIVYRKFVDHIFQEQYYNHMLDYFIFRKTVMEHCIKNDNTQKFASKLWSFVVTLANQAEKIPIKAMELENEFESYILLSFSTNSYKNWRNNVLHWGIDRLSEKSKLLPRKKRWDTALQVWQDCNSEKYSYRMSRKINAGILQLDNASGGDKDEFFPIFVDYLKENLNDKSNFLTASTVDIDRQTEYRNFYISFLCKLKKQDHRLYSKWRDILIESNCSYILMKSKDEKYLNKNMPRTLSYINHYSHDDPEWLKWFFQQIEKKDNSDEIWHSIVEEMPDYTENDELLKKYSPAPSKGKEASSFIQ